MSFLSVLKTIGKGVETGVKVAAPFVTAANPAAGITLNLALNTVAALEQLIPQKGQGLAKKVIAENIIHENLGINVDVKAVSDAIDSAVKLMNSVADIHKNDPAPVLESTSISAMNGPTIGKVLAIATPDGKILASAPNSTDDLFEAIDQLVSAFKASYKK